MQSGAALAFFVTHRMIAASALSLMVLGCSSGKDDPQPTTDLRYCDVEAIFQNKCVRCHSEDGDVTTPFYLETYDQIDDRANSIKSAVSRGGASGMPPQPDTYDVEPPVEPLSDVERELIVEWISGGAPEGSAASCD